MAQGDKYRLIQATLPCGWRSRWPGRDKTDFQGQMKFLLEERLWTQRLWGSGIHYWIYSLTDESEKWGISSGCTFKAITMHLEVAFWKWSSFLVKNSGPQWLDSTLGTVPSGHRLETQRNHVFPLHAIPRLIVHLCSLASSPSREWMTAAKHLGNSSKGIATAAPSQGGTRPVAKCVSISVSILGG